MNEDRSSPGRRIQLRVEKLCAEHGVPNTFYLGEFDWSGLPHLRWRAVRAALDGGYRFLVNDGRDRAIATYRPSAGSIAARVRVEFDDNDGAVLESRLESALKGVDAEVQKIVRENLGITDPAKDWPYLRGDVAGEPERITEALRAAWLAGYKAGLR